MRGCIAERMQQVDLPVPHVVLCASSIVGSPLGILRCRGVCTCMCLLEMLDVM